MNILIALIGGMVGGIVGYVVATYLLNKFLVDMDYGYLIRKEIK